ncbi:hypothetical protein D5086_010976 [Populus alba]|uniref:Uncharacterized protein n=1 Tax=Populus alba TaxID=43335 RepID=A0ACC4CCB4_POPAL
MSEGGKRSSSNGFEKPLTTEDQQARVYPSYVLVSFTSTYGRKNLKHMTLSILQGEVAHEAQTGKVYRSNYFDKHGRTVLVMRPSCQVAKAFLEPKTSNNVKEDDGGRQEDAFILYKSEFPLGSSTTGPGICYFGTNFPPAVRTKDTAKLYLKELGMNLFLKSFYVILSP